MRIMIATDQYPPMVGGVSTVTSNLAQDLAEVGHRVCVVAPGSSHHAVHGQRERVHIYRFASFELPGTQGQRIALLPAGPISDLMRTFQPDVVHIHSPLVLGTIAQGLAATHHIPMIGTNHYMPLNVLPRLDRATLVYRGVGTLTYRYLVGFYNRCDFVTAPTGVALDLLKRRGLRVPARAISNGVDLCRFRPGGRDDAWRRALGLPADRPIVLYMGRLSREKRVAVLLDAMARVGARAHLVVGGSGPARDELETRAYALGITGSVTFAGHVPDERLVSLYQLADVFAMPSVAELQSLVTLEAMAVGLPVVAANAAALPELVRDGANGYLFAPDDSDALAERLSRLVDDAWLRQAMGEEARATAARHDRRLVVHEWQRLYASVAAGERLASVR